MSCLVAIQINSIPDIKQNLESIEQQLNRLPSIRPMLVVLPEAVFSLGGPESLLLQQAEKLDNGPLQTWCADKAHQHGIYLVAGTLPIVSSPGNVFATSIVYSPTGTRISHYSKVHLFDVTVADGVGGYRESDYVTPGNELVSFNSPWGPVGQAVCYDLRFSRHFDQLLGCNLFVLPSAFTHYTGAAHWLPLLQARAIETQAYWVAANQTGWHNSKRKTFGHSVVVSPWGEILSMKTEQDGFALAFYDPDVLSDIRAKMPIIKQRREDVYRAK